MDYTQLAEELLAIQLSMVQFPAAQALTKLEHGEHFILNYLLTHDGPIHPKTLSSAMAVSTARIATILKRLEEKEEILRHIDGNDKRQVVVVLTDMGAAKSKESLADTLGQIRMLLEELGPEDARAYIRIKRKIYDQYFGKQ